MIKIGYIEQIINLVFPPVCGFCNTINESYLCENCRKKLKLIHKSKIDIYSGKNTNFIEHFYLYNYESEVRNYILNYKFKEKSYMYKTFAQILKEDENFNKFIKKYDCIMSVPIHKKRMKIRGYNQSKLIAKEIAIFYKKEFYNNILKKQKNIVPQSSLNKEQRKLNAQGAYIVENKEKIQGKKVLLFDDIFTTGATVNECSKMLLENGALSVGICTIAKDLLYKK